MVASGLPMTEDHRRLRALVHAQASMAAAGPDLRALLQAVVVDARELTGAESARVELLGLEGKVSRGAASGGYVEVGLVPSRDSVPGRALSERRIVLDEGGATAAAIAAPLVTDDRALGVLTIESGVGGAFTDDDLDTMSTLSRTLAHHVDCATRFAEAERACRIDSLTGLGNRRALEETLETELARHERYGTQLTLCLVDLDGFKIVNDTHGHQAGDRALVRVASRLSEIRGSDSAFRLGGDEFALVLPETGPEEASLVARRLARRVRDDAFPVELTASWGVAVAQTADADALIAAADAELYARKRGETGEQATG